MSSSTEEIIDKGRPQHHAFERFREYLHLLARMNLGAKYQKKLDASDVVQHALLEAHKHRDYYRGKSDSELAGWLRQILATSLALAIRALDQQKRDVERECSLEEALDASSAQLERILAVDQSSPSQQAVKEERLLQLAEALASLPELQRDAVMMRHCQGLSIAEIGARLDKTSRAVAGLLQRGTQQLRNFLFEKE